MESTQRLVRTWIATGREQEIDETVSEISNGQTSLLNVVKALGDYLTSEEEDLRSKGVDFLSSVISRCPPQKFNMSSVRVLTSFYCDKLGDTEAIVPSLKGLVSLSMLPSISSADASAIIRALFEHIRMKALVQSVRFNVFTIVDTLMAKHRDVLKEINNEFLDGYISLADGEKDPRNLLVAFAIARVILIEFDITRHVESLFNITFCYFPITFRPPPNDPYGITTEQLRTALRSCLNGTPAFGSLAIPLFLEKLLAGSPSTKRDTLESMAVCLPVYGPAVARSFARKLWSSIKLEIFQPTDPLTEQEALKAIQVLVTTIHAPEERAIEDDEDIQGFARDACIECLQILKEPEKSQAKPAIKVLCAFVSTIPSIARYTVSQAVSHLVKLFMSPDEVLTRPAIMQLLLELIAAIRDSSLKNNLEVVQHLALLGPYKDEVFSVTVVALGTDSTRRFALLMLICLVMMKGLLSDDEIGMVVNIANDILQSNPDEDDSTSDALISLLAMIATTNSRLIEESTLPILFSALPDDAPTRDANVERAKCWRILNTLSKLCLQPDLFETLVVRLLTKLDFVCVPRSDAMLMDIEPNSAYAHAILKTISRTLSSKVEKGHADIQKHINRFIPQLCNLLIYSALVSDEQEMPAADHRVVGAAAEVVSIVVQTLTPNQQEVFMTTLIKFIYSNELEDHFEGSRKFPPGKTLNIFNGSCSTPRNNLVALLAAGLIPLHAQVTISVPDLSQFLRDIRIWCINYAGNDLQHESAWHIMSVIVNKQTEGVMEFLQDTLGSFWQTEVLDSAKPIPHRQEAIRAFKSVAKGLLVNGHSLLLRFRDALFEVVKNEEIGWEAAKAIGEIAVIDNVLTKKNHAVVKYLYSQKYVSQALPRIVANSRDSDNPSSQMAHLVALTTVIRAVTRAAYAHAMPLLMPLLLRGLVIPDAAIRASIIDTLLDIAISGESLEQNIISQHATSLVNAMLNNCVDDQVQSVRVRIAALRLLAALPGLVRYDVLHPSKPTVLRELAKALDDPKRAVRKEAVEARSNWYD
ncbi:hypothetical protein AMATHDRAFT_74737 [Amanita thiersii Skay4041]|uniref:MMS19 nucleotide excision repair protein n=1 Tax=Amanita thiersii Skay4041 TaxID=703135 RepID=A0A2A9NVZ7_9AGAR|nr:hypothetical protein AMATHDRAFT_74737 [Amanita thiersii Skay4041]